MPILESRGVFWWHDEPVPDGLLAPDPHVVGTLKVDDDGRATLELDGVLTNEHGPMSAVMRREAPEPKYIQGILKDEGQRVLLLNVFKSGGHLSTYGISYEKFSALNCLVGNKAVPTEVLPLTFIELEVDLEGFEEWLRLGSIETVREKSTVSAKYNKPEDAVYLTDSGTLSINFDITGPFPGTHRDDALSLKESASAIWTPARPSQLEELQTEYGLLEDLLILLTDSDYCLDWPVISLTKDLHYKWYFLRHRGRAAVAAPEYFECWTNFLQLRAEFGSIWSNWKKKHVEFGAGFYLYLGTRRGLKMYEEHRFVNLVWGIEAFHRTKVAPPDPKRLNDMIERIVGQVGAEKDKKLLRKRLKLAHEPALGQRLFEVFKGLPIGLDQERLREFCDACAKLRNDISHFGRPQNARSSLNFIRELDKRSTALATLYHTLLLLEIGVDVKIVKHWICEGISSYSIKRNFVEAGLLDEASVKDSGSDIGGSA
jgi:hypothetical protein